jgi:hypothetical protein
VHVFKLPLQHPDAFNITVAFIITTVIVTITVTVTITITVTITTTTTTMAISITTTIIITTLHALIICLLSSCLVRSSKLRVWMRSGQASEMCPLPPSFTSTRID